jgi:hypothetical protein
MAYGTVNADVIGTSVAGSNLGADFMPTLLLVKKHNLTGKKYFCKTTRLDIAHWYLGSGIHWKRHLKVHGKNVTTGVLGFYLDKQKCVDAALAFSKENNIVESDEWLNLIEENGLSGAGAGEQHHMWGKTHPDKGSKRPNVGKSGSNNPMYGKPSAMRGKSNLGASLAHKGRKRPEGGGKKPHAVVGMKDGKEHHFESVADAARFINGSRSSINKCCNGKAKTGGGYTWEYREQI